MVISASHASLRSVLRCSMTSKEISYKMFTYYLCNDHKTAKILRQEPSVITLMSRCAVRFSQ